MMINNIILIDLIIVLINMIITYLQKVVIVNSMIDSQWKSMDVKVDIRVRMWRCEKVRRRWTKRLRLTLKKVLVVEEVAVDVVNFRFVSTADNKRQCYHDGVQLRVREVLFLPSLGAVIAQVLVDFGASTLFCNYTVNLLFN